MGRMGRGEERKTEIMGFAGNELVIIGRVCECWWKWWIWWNR